MEQYLMSAKAELFGDQQSVVKIHRTRDPVEQKRLGHKIQNYRQDKWESEMEGILFKGLMAKFEQNLDAANFLLATEDNNIIEANPKDSVFGVGLGLNQQDIWKRSMWKGANIQGKTLEKVRSILKEKQQ